MSRSEFRYNKKRKHYAYLFKDVGSKRLNIILSSKPFRKEHKRMKKNVILTHHPNPNSNKQVFLVPIVYKDEIICFDSKVLKWVFHRNDKRKIKRLKKYHKI